MQKPKILLHQFKLPLFKSTIWIVIGNTVKDAIDYAEDRISHVIAKEEDKNSIAAMYYSYITEKGGKRHILLFRAKVTPGEIAHEAKHLINGLFLWHGQKLSLTNDEAECYYLQTIVDKIHNTIKRYKRLK